MLTDEQVGEESGWMVCRRNDGPAASWVPLVALSSKTGAYERCDREALNDPRSQYAVFRAHVLVRGVVSVEREGAV